MTQKDPLTDLNKFSTSDYLPQPCKMFSLEHKPHKIIPLK